MNQVMGMLGAFERSWRPHWIASPLAFHLLVFLCAAVLSVAALVIAPAVIGHKRYWSLDSKLHAIPGIPLALTMLYVIAYSVGTIVARANEAGVTSTAINLLGGKVDETQLSYAVAFAPFYVFLTAAILDKSLNKTAAWIFGLWAGFSVTYAFLYMVTTIANNLVIGIFVACIVLVVSVLDRTGIKDNYSIKRLFSGLDLKMRDGFDQRRQFTIRQIAIISVFSAFYFEVTISESTQVSYYTSILAGVLSVIGFLALIFTFTFEIMKTSIKARRNVAADTKEAQQAMALLIALTIAGIFASDEPLRLRLSEINGGNLLPITLFVACVIGGGSAVDLTITFFHRIVDLVTESNIVASSGLSFAFAEMGTPKDYSSVSAAPTGLSRMRAHLEDQGDYVLTIEKADALTIRRMTNTIIVVPRIVDELPDDEFKFYRNFVRRGNSILILVDQGDVDHKRALLGHLDVDTVDDEDLSDIKTSFLELPEGSEIDELGFVRPLLFNPVFLAPQVDATLHASDRSVEPSNRTSMLIHSIGKGKVIVIGSIDHWSNSNIGADNNILFLDYTRDLFREAFDQQTT